MGQARATKERVVEVLKMGKRYERILHAERAVIEAAERWRESYNFEEDGTVARAVDALRKAREM